MNKEQQYRTGIWPEPDAIPRWVLERLEELQRNRVDSIDVISKMRGLMREICTPDPAVITARAVLGLGSTAPEGGLLAHTQALVDAQPEREAELWEAMWVARRIAGLQSEYQHFLPVGADDYEIMKSQSEAGWPVQWASDYCELWTEIGGSPSTARAWAHAGWSPVEVLTERVTVSGRTLDLAARVRNLRPPRRQSGSPKPVPAAMPMPARNASQGGPR